MTRPRARRLPVAGYRRSQAPSGGAATALGLAGALFAAGMLAGRRDRELAAARAELSDLRREADRAGERAQMLERVGDTVRDLIASPRTRDEVCRAVTELAAAQAALIYEPDETGALIATALVGIDFGDRPARLDPTSRANRAFEVARPVFLAGAREDRVASVELWQAAGRPASVLYQPMVRSGATLGVLAAGWQEVIPFDGPQCAAVALLAHEAAAVIAHADAVESAAGMALTDPLTGLINRRGLEARLGGVLAGHAAVAVVTLDVDAFARYNEVAGHLAGDRLLKTTAAAWRSTLRPGDLLARVDAARFTLVLSEGDGPRAVAIAERLRARMPDGQTCSAGIALRGAHEPAQALLRRTDEALLAAKADGRDRLRLSDAAD